MSRASRITSDHKRVIATRGLRESRSSPVIEHFEPLRNMEAFSEDMFNRIIAFQERQHPAWKSELTFTQRIEGLPLHYLVFSAPDRDPAKFGPTGAPFIPLRAEMRMLAAYARQGADQPVICDLHAGNGFVGSLLAREGVKVIGVRVLVVFLFFFFLY